MFWLTIESKVCYDGRPPNENILEYHSVTDFFGDLCSLSLHFYCYYMTNEADIISETVEFIFTAFH